ncbi:hypothetical protein Ancab_007567 [Ancistrocladus abbreviatus]
MLLLSIVVITLTYWVNPVTCSALGHHYDVGDQISLFANKVGPLNNPSETYEYFDLPFCLPDQLIRKKETLGEVLNGDRLTNSVYELKFREEKIEETLCTKTLTNDEVAKFRDAAIRDFYFQMYYDDLPLWGFVGKVEEENFVLDGKGPKYYLFSHVQFDVRYNGNHVIEIHAFSDPNYAMDITEDGEIDIKFTYSVNWNATSEQFENRMDRYSRASLLPPLEQLHWFSVANSVVIIFLSLGLLTVLYWWNLKSDLRKCSTGDEEEDKEVSWICINDDVSKCPLSMSLFSAVLGCGTQILTLICCLFVLAFVGVLHPHSRGTLWSSVVVIYNLTSVVAGYTAASFHCQFAETGWERSMILTGILYMGPLFLEVFILNTIATLYGATAALPLGTIVVIGLMYTLITVPLVAFGGVIGHRSTFIIQIPSTKRSLREIPPLNWYKKMHCQMFLAGLLPFSAILVELHLLYASLWSYKMFTTPSILFITFCILILLTALLSVGLTYFQLSMEDHQWWWRSFLRGGSTAIFMFIYCIYFYARSDMSGLMQLFFFLGYNACICYAIFLMLGTIAFRASLLFVRCIYHSVKSE